MRNHWHHNLLESLFMAFPCRRIRFQDDEFLCEACDAFVDADVGLCRLQRQSSQTSSLVCTVNRTMTYGQTALVRIEGWHEHTRQWLSLWTLQTCMEVRVVPCERSRTAEGALHPLHPLTHGQTKLGISLSQCRRLVHIDEWLIILFFSNLPAHEATSVCNTRTDTAQRKMRIASASC